VQDSPEKAESFQSTSSWPQVLVADDAIHSTAFDAPILHAMQIL
jgi:hypothetical protein